MHKELIRLIEIAGAAIEAEKIDSSLEQSQQTRIKWVYHRIVQVAGEL